MHFFSFLAMWYRISVDTGLVCKESVCEVNFNILVSWEDNWSIAIHFPVHPEAFTFPAICANISFIKISNFMSDKYRCLTNETTCHKYRTAPCSILR